MEKKIKSLVVYEHVYYKLICPECQSDDIQNGKKQVCRACNKTGHLFPMKNASQSEINKWLISQRG